MTRRLMEEPAWRVLSCTAKALYPWLRLEWHGPQANNNGQIRLSVRQAAERLGVTPNTAASAFHDLQAKGFLVVTELAHLGTSGAARSHAYELTEIELPHASQHGGRRLYRQWRKGQEFVVHKAAVHNPRGRFRKADTCLVIEDETVSRIETYRRRTSQ
jgi:hypothetical protein